MEIGVGYRGIIILCIYDERWYRCKVDYLFSGSFFPMLKFNKFKKISIRFSFFFPEYPRAATQINDEFEQLISF